MKIIYPPRLKKGDNIRIIAPSRSMSLLSEDTVREAVGKLGSIGLKVSFGRNVNEVDNFLSSSVKSRIDDLHDAFKDNNVNGILSVVGGYNSNQMLDYINYDLIQDNPKILCGFSDITAISNAIFAQTGIVGYSGPHFSSWGIKKGFEFSIDHFKKCCLESELFTLGISDKWSDDEWYLDQEKREFIDNEGYWLIRGGIAQGRLLGGHSPCLISLQGTKYFPNFTEDTILFLETDEEFTPTLFDRELQSLIQQSGFGNVKGLVIGRFQKNTGMTRKSLAQIIETKLELKGIPVIANVDFGHTMPFITFPIGGEVIIDSIKGVIKIIKH